MWPFKPRPIRSSARAGLHPRLVGPVRPFSRLSTPFPLLSARPSTAFPPRPPVYSYARLPVCPTASSAPVCPSARSLRARIVHHVRPPCLPPPLCLRETTAAIYIPPRLPSDHPAPRSPRWAPSLCCAFKDYGTARGSRTSGGWSELRGKLLQFFFCAASKMERETIYIQGDRATAAAKSPRLITNGGRRQELKPQ